MHRFPTLFQACGPVPAALSALALAAVLTAPAAQANPVRASASQNLVGSTQDSNEGASATAVFPPGAHGAATRRIVSYWTDGTTGSTATTAFAASGSASSQYDLWNLGENRALTAPEAAGIELGFEFLVRAHMTVDAISLSAASVSYGATLYSTGYEQAGRYTQAVFGPTGYLYHPGGWYGDLNHRFTLTHHARQDGRIDFDTFGSAAYQSRSWSTMEWEGVALLAGSLPGGGLGVRLRETGEVIVVSTPVPEPATWAQLGAGLALAGVWLKRRRRVA